MNTSDLDKMVKRVASENGFGLHKDDPEMVLVTVINQIIEDQQVGVVAALEKYREVHEDMAVRWRHDAAGVANKILNAALDAGRAEMAKGMSAGAAQVVRLVNEATAAALAEHCKTNLEAVREMRRYTILILSATAVALAGAVIMVVLKAGG